MNDLDTREWLLTNGMGSFASGTVSDIRTRTYHGWLIAATSPPSERTLLLSHLEASLELPGRVVALGTNFWGSGQVEPTGYKLQRSFDINPVPKWIWGEDDWQLSRQLIMPYGREWGEGETRRGGDKERGRQEEIRDISVVPLSPCPPLPVSSFNHRILIQYRYEGKDAAILRLRMLIGDRNFHHQQKATKELYFSQMLGQQQVCLQAINSGNFGTPWHLRWEKGNYQSDTVWYWNYQLLEETQRGLGDREDLFSPGYLTVALNPGDAITLEAQVGFPKPTSDILTSETFNEALEAEQERLFQIFAWRGDKETRRQGDKETRRQGDKETRRQGEFLNNTPLVPPSPCPPLPLSPPPLVSPSFSIWQKLLRASDQFIVYRASIAGPTVIAGYHWFNDWGRDTLIALPGLALVPQRFELAKGVLKTFGRYCQYGLLPNAFPDVGQEPFYNSIDAALWWIETLGLYLEATQDWEFLAEQYPVVQQIHKAFIGGTRYNIQVDSIDGLVSWDTRNEALTWMDVVIGGQPVTPRRGKPVEINALWYSALCWASRWAEILSEQEPPAESTRLVKQGQRYIEQAKQVQFSLQKFWNPQLGYLYDTIEPDDRRNSQIRPNAVLALSLRHCGFSEQQGRQILDKATSCLLTPYGLRSLDRSDREYIGRYLGNPEQRDRAYHQGTVWTWLIGPFIRAWERFYPEEPLPFDWQPLLDHFLNDACIGSISEIFDGDEPHYPRGAIAQAWSVAEVVRHYRS
ncbi:glycogen debranching enzyme N-terminal domain-containing protein [Scytonema hofmannii FACHB-248]|uniref:Glycogen debranching enzyme N-terminal domain-containing protein n=1 Tax=Scytonema hofmannii FACHB-248 TaxID=1842502 RepID=A0ABR8GRC4_9CYAN|nr:MULTISPECIES: amylo-alpha-1,6-glucosidase [Nostocales]MBD2605693.1 glycogen debranching enzyme N-terminal domain-containing protein [Scytonema hofmannii FACHB-248]